MLGCLLDLASGQRPGTGGWAELKEVRCDNSAIMENWVQKKALREIAIQKNLETGSRALWDSLKQHLKSACESFSQYYSIRVNCTENEERFTVEMIVPADHLTRFHSQTDRLEVLAVSGQKRVISQLRVNPGSTNEEAFTITADEQGTYVGEYPRMSAEQASEAILKPFLFRDEVKVKSSRATDQDQ